MRRRRRRRLTTRTAIAGTCKPRFVVVLIVGVVGEGRSPATLGPGGGSPRGCGPGGQKKGWRQHSFGSHRQGNAVALEGHSRRPAAEGAAEAGVNQKAVIASMSFGTRVQGGRPRGCSR